MRQGSLWRWCWMTVDPSLGSSLELRSKKLSLQLRLKKPCLKICSSECDLWPWHVAWKRSIASREKNPYQFFVGALWHF